MYFQKYYVIFQYFMWSILKHFWWSIEKESKKIEINRNEKNKWENSKNSRINENEIWFAVPTDMNETSRYNNTMHSFLALHPNISKTAKEIKKNSVKPNSRESPVEFRWSIDS